MKEVFHRSELPTIVYLKPFNFTIELGANKTKEEF